MPGSGRPGAGAAPGCRTPRLSRAFSAITFGAAKARAANARDSARENFMLKRLKKVVKFDVVKMNFRTVVYTCLL
jgi:hypothetical protein